MKYFLITAIGGSLIVFGLVKLLAQSTSPAVRKGASVSYKDQQRQVGAVTVDATALELAYGKPPEFELKFNTHSQDLGFAVDKVASLIDDNGKIYTGSAWEGDPLGGHHRSGVLTFSEQLSVSAKSVKLSLKSLPVEFFWDISR